MTITLVIGSCATGKTTFVKEKYPHASLYLDYTSDNYTPEFITDFATKNQGACIVLDDIQNTCIKGIDWNKLSMNNDWILVGQYDKQFPRILREATAFIFHFGNIPRYMYKEYKSSS